MFFFSKSELSKRSLRVNTHAKNQQKSLKLQIISACSHCLKERWGFSAFFGLPLVRWLCNSVCASWAHEPPVTRLGLFLSPSLSPCGRQQPFLKAARCPLLFNMRGQTANQTLVSCERRTWKGTENLCLDTYCPPKWGWSDVSFGRKGDGVVLGSLSSCPD